MIRILARALTVAALAVAGFAGGAVVAAPAVADTVCVINGVRQPCPKPDYENDCEGELRRPDCDAPPPASDPTTEPAAPPAADQPKAAEPNTNSGQPASTKRSTTTQTGQSVTTVTVDEADGSVTIETLPAYVYNERRGMSRMGWPITT